jgi:hypothetical protein
MTPDKQTRRGAGQPHRDAPTGRTQHSTPLDAEQVRAIARDEIRQMLGRLLADEPATYSTRAGQAPPGYSRDVWRAVARAIGTRRGRWWVVTRAQLAAHERAQGTAATSAENDSEPWTPAAALRSIGLRASR